MGPFCEDQHRHLQSRRFCYRRAIHRRIHLPFMDMVGTNYKQHKLYSIVYEFSFPSLAVIVHMLGLLLVLPHSVYVYQWLDNVLSIPLRREKSKSSGTIKSRGNPHSINTRIICSFVFQEAWHRIHCRSLLLSACISAC